MWSADAKWLSIMLVCALAEWSPCLQRWEGRPVRYRRQSVLHVSRNVRGCPSAPTGATRQTMTLRSTLVHTQLEVNG